jgi:acyl carrier protein
MTGIEIEKIVFDILNNYCEANNIQNIEINQHTALIGSNRLCDSIGLVNIIADIEIEFLDNDVEVSLTSEAAMSSRISPFRSVGALCNFIASQLGIEEK